MGRSPCCDENGLKKGPWTPEEDQKLVEHIQKHGHGSWRALPKLAGMCAHLLFFIAIIKFFSFQWCSLFISLCNLQFRRS